MVNTPEKETRRLLALFEAAQRPPERLQRRWLKQRGRISLFICALIVLLLLWAGAPFWVILLLFLWPVFA